MPTDIGEAKKALRKAILQKRRHMDEAVCRQYGRQFAERIANLDEYKDADTILCYASCKGEADTWILIEKALEMGKRVALPRVTGAHEMHFYRIASMKDVLPGYYDIPEPSAACQEEIFEGFLIVPGTAFDRQMHRMGYGGGFYDVWLKRYGSQVTACGLAYDFQLRNEIPFERHDRMMDIVITPDEVIRKGDAADDSD